MDMPMSNEKLAKATNASQVGTDTDNFIVLCLSVGHRSTLIGLPFAAAIPCSKCLFINVFDESQQPVTDHW